MAIFARSYIFNVEAVLFWWNRGEDTVTAKSLPIWSHVLNKTGDSTYAWHRRYAAMRTNPLPLCRAEAGAVMLFSRAQARTAYINGTELALLRSWSESGKETPFIAKLYALDLLDPAMRPLLARACRQAYIGNAPPRSFAAPESVHIELTTACDFNCPVCYKAHKKDTEDRHLSYTRLAAILREAANLNVFQVAFGGGEPLCYPWLEEAVGLASELGLAVTITSNGSFDANRLDTLIQAGLDHIQISLNGSSHEINRLTRTGFDMAVNALKLLSQNGMSFGVNWVACRENLHDLPGLLELCRTVRVGNCNLLRLKPIQSGKMPVQDLACDDWSFVRRVIMNHRHRGVKLRLDSGFSNLLCSLHGWNGFMGGCAAARRFVAVDVEGRFKPCSHLPFPEAMESLEDYWHHGQMPALLRAMEEHVGEPCSTCMHCSACRGCRAIALSLHHNLTAGMAGCPFSSTTMC